MFILANILPKLTSVDGGTTRRLRNIPFESKFVDDPSDEKYARLTNVFPVNRDLSKHFQS